MSGEFEKLLKACSLTHRMSLPSSQSKMVSTDTDKGKTLMDATLEPARVELEQAVASYVAAHYATEAVRWKLGKHGSSAWLYSCFSVSLSQ